MRHKKILIAIVILLVLGLGLFSEYQRRTRDIEFEIPSILSDSLINGMNHDISNHWVVFQDNKNALILYDILKKTRTTICSYTYFPNPSICEPWIVWEKNRPGETQFSGYNFRLTLILSLGSDTSFLGSPKVDGNILVWRGEGICGYDLGKKTKFVVPAGLYSDFDIRGNIIVVQEVEDDPGNSRITGYDIETQRKFDIRNNISEKHSVKISDRYVVWKENERYQEEILYSIMAYDINTGEVITICTGIDNSFDIDISGDIVVWDQDSSSTGCSDIFGYNLKTREQFPICTADYFQHAPKISGNTVIWLDDRPQDWLAKLLKKEPCQIRGKTFRRWPGEESGGDN